MPKFIQDHFSGDIVNTDQIARIKRMPDGNYLAVDANGNEVCKMDDLDALALAERGVVVPAAPGTKAIVLRCMVDWRVVRPTLKDIEALEHDVVAWRVAEVAYPVFATAFGTDDEKVLFKRPDGRVTAFLDDVVTTLDEAKRDYLEEAQENYNLNRKDGTEQLH
jgi:hypothetical protein